MSRSGWGVVVAIVVAVIASSALLAALYPEQPNLSGNVGSREKDSAYRAGGSVCDQSQVDVALGWERFRRAKACREAEEEHRLKANDLIQQQRAAHAAETSAVYAFQQTRIAAWALFLGGFTLIAASVAAYFAREAASHAGTAARQAIDANEIAKANSHWQIRPYLTFKEGKVEVSRNADLIYCKGHIVVKNTGATPALINRHLYNHTFFTWSEWKGAPGIESWQSSIVGPDGDMIISIEGAVDISHDATKENVEFTIITGILFEYGFDGNDFWQEEVWLRVTRNLRDGEVIQNLDVNQIISPMGSSYFMNGSKLEFSY